MKVDKTKWKKVRLGDVCEFMRGLTYPKNVESEKPTSNVVLRSNNIDLECHKLCLDELKYLREDYTIPEDKRIKEHSILVCMSNGSSKHIGKVAYINTQEDYAFGGFMGLIIPNDSVYSKFIFFSCQSRIYKEFISKVGNGINITNLKFSTLRDCPLLLPSLPEQQAIAAELDAIQSVIDKLQEQLRDYDTLAQSIFNEMFGDVAYNDRAWETKTLQEIGTLKNGLNYDKGESGHSIRIVGVGDFKNLTRIDDISTLSQIELSQPVPSEYLLKDEDIVFVRSNGNKELVGRCVEVYTQNADVTFSGFCIRFRKEQDGVINKYLLYLLTNNEYKKQHILKSNGIGIKSINQKILGCMPIPLPPISLQRQFAERIELIEVQKTLLRQQMEDARQLMDSRMQYYFE